MRIVWSRGVSGSFALLWLMMRKQPGKICRNGAVSPPQAPPQGDRFQEIIQQYQRNEPRKRHGTGIA
jgi:hypothetical protein